MEANVDSAPVIDDPVLITYGQYECLGYLDSFGKWRDWYSDRELPAPTDWVSLG